MIISRSFLFPWVILWTSIGFPSHCLGAHELRGRRARTGDPSITISQFRQAAKKSCWTWVGIGSCIDESSKSYDFQACGRTLSNLADCIEVAEEWQLALAVEYFSDLGKCLILFEAASKYEDYDCRLQLGSNWVVETDLASDAESQFCFACKEEDPTSQQPVDPPTNTPTSSQTSVPTTTLDLLKIDDHAAVLDCSTTVESRSCFDARATSKSPVCQSPTNVASVEECIQLAESIADDRVSSVELVSGEAQSLCLVILDLDDTSPDLVNNLCQYWNWRSLDPTVSQPSAKTLTRGVTLYHNVGCQKCTSSKPAPIRHCSKFGTGHCRDANGNGYTECSTWFLHLDTCQSEAEAYPQVVGFEYGRVATSNHMVCLLLIDQQYSCGDLGQVSLPTGPQGLPVQVEPDKRLRHGLHCHLCRESSSNFPTTIPSNLPSSVPTSFPSMALPSGSPTTPPTTPAPTPPPTFSPSTLSPTTLLQLDDHVAELDCSLSVGAQSCHDDAHKRHFRTCQARAADTLDSCSRVAESIMDDRVMGVEFLDFEAESQCFILLDTGISETVAGELCQYWNLTAVIDEITVASRAQDLKNGVSLLHFVDCQKCSVVKPDLPAAQRNCSHYVGRGHCRDADGHSYIPCNHWSTDVPTCLAAAASYPQVAGIEYFLFIARPCVLLIDQRYACPDLGQVALPVGPQGIPVSVVPYSSPDYLVGDCYACYSSPTPTITATPTDVPSRKPTTATPTTSLSGGPSLTPSTAAPSTRPSPSFSTGLPTSDPTEDVLRLGDHATFLNCNTTLDPNVCQESHANLSLACLAPLEENEAQECFQLAQSINDDRVVGVEFVSWRGETSCSIVLDIGNNTNTTHTSSALCQHWNLIAITPGLSGQSPQAKNLPHGVPLPHFVECRTCTATAKRTVPPTLSPISGSIHDCSKWVGDGGCLDSNGRSFTRCTIAFIGLSLCQRNAASIPQVVGFEYTVGEVNWCDLLIDEEYQCNDLAAKSLPPGLQGFPVQTQYVSNSDCYTCGPAT